jgi:spoIIIJ-associated protein
MSADEDVDARDLDDEELEPAELLAELLEEVTAGLGLDVEVEVEEQAGLLRGRIVGDDVGLFIGRRGQTIDAVQHLAQRIVFPDGPSSTRVEVDADDAADEALREGRAVELDPMPASERRIVHEHLRDRGGVETHSEGDEPERYLVVTPADD